MLESTWTRPSVVCPHPEHWNANDDDSTEYEITELVSAFIRALQPEFIIETGSAFGQTSKAIGEALQRNKHGRLVTIEVDKNRYELVKSICIGLPVSVLQMNSLDYIPEERVDFVWFDSLLHLRHQEFLKYRPYFSNRCIVGFHDTANHHETRRHLTEHLINPGFIKPIFLPTPRGVCFAEVIH